MTSSCVAPKAYLINRVLFLNGLTRAGKFILGKLVACIEPVEYFQYVSVLEHIPFLHRFGLIDEQAAIGLLRVNVDEHAYNYLVGRNLNGRFSDASSIYNTPHFENYLSRSISENIPALLDRFKSERRLPCFIIHEMMPNIEIYFKAFPQVQIVDLHRHPVDLVHSWLVRGWGQRFTEDPLYFAPVIGRTGQTGAVPWFAASWQEEYQSLSPVDRIIRSVVYLIEEGEKTYRGLIPAGQSRIHRITYEALIENTGAIVEAMAGFLDVPVGEGLATVMAREHVPKKLSPDKRKQKLFEIGQIASTPCLALLQQCSKKYEAEWSL